MPTPCSARVGAAIGLPIRSIGRARRRRRQHSREQRAAAARGRHRPPAESRPARVTDRIRHPTTPSPPLRACARQPSLRQQLHGPLDRNANDAGLPIHPAVAAQDAHPRCARMRAGPARGSAAGAAPAATCGPSSTPADWPAGSAAPRVRQEAEDQTHQQHATTTSSIDEDRAPRSAIRREDRRRAFRGRRAPPCGVARRCCFLMLHAHARASGRRIVDRPAASDPSSCHDEEPSNQMPPTPISVASPSSVIVQRPAVQRPAPPSSTRPTIAHHDQPTPRRPAAARVALQVARQQDQERHHEVQQDQQRRRPSASRPCSAVRYQGISSGRLPAQMIRNCENVK